MGIYRISAIQTPHWDAIDAAITAVAVQSIVETHMTGIGGDCFVVYAPKALSSGAIFELRGSKNDQPFWVPFLFRNALSMSQGLAD